MNMRIGTKQMKKDRTGRKAGVNERYTLKPHEKRELVEMAKRAKNVDTKLIYALAQRFGCARKIVHEVLTAHQFDMSMVTGQLPDRDAEQVEKKAEREKLVLGLSKPTPKVPAPAPKTDSQDVKEMRNLLAIRQTELDKRAADLDRRERDVLAAQRAADAAYEEALAMVEASEKGGQEAEPAEPAAAKTMPVRDRFEDAVPVRLWASGMVYQALGVREVRIAQLQRELDAERERKVEGADVRELEEKVSDLRAECENWATMVDAMEAKMAKAKTEAKAAPRVAGSDATVAKLEAQVKALRAALNAALEASGTDPEVEAKLEELERKVAAQAAVIAELVKGFEHG